MRKPELLALLREEQAAINWRAQTTGARVRAAAVELTTGFCSFCGAKMPVEPSGKCPLCCLAAAQFYEARGSAGQPTYPFSPIVVALIQWDMTSARKDAA